MHSKGIVHRDLKPNNLLYCKNSKTLKITDFNVAKFFESDYKSLDTLQDEDLVMFTYTGTLAFSAPEIFENVPYTAKVDLWSAGCVLYTMLCGREPFQDR